MTAAPIPIRTTEEDACLLKDSERFEFARRLEVPIWIFDIDNGRVLFANNAACDLWRAETEEELRGRKMREDMSSTVTKRLQQYQSDFVASDSSFKEMWTLYPNGTPKSLMVTFRGFRLSDGRMAMQCEALSEAQALPKNLRSAEALLHTDVMITLFSKDGPPLYLNPAARNVFSDSSMSFEAMFTDYRDCDLLLEQLDLLGEYRMVARVVTVNGPRWFDLSAKHCSDAVTGKPAILLTAIDVSELKEARDTARHLANRDQLTGLYNRTYLQAHLSKLNATSTTDNCAIIFFDVDRFKMINDRFGHDAGDRVLQHIADRTRSNLRHTDMVARLGGDEFVVLLEKVTDICEVEARTERLRMAMSEPVRHGETEIDVGISLGIALFCPHRKSFNEVLREADIALYASKQSGRNRATLFTKEMGAAAKARDDLEVALKNAVERDEFVLHYQPRLDVASGRIAAAEGLVRWKHPEKGLVMPDAFIPICEETGLIEKLGRRVLEMGVRQAIEWQRQGLDITVSLNASPRQFGDERLLETLRTLAALPDFPAGKIEIEVTESVLSGDPAILAERLMRITDIGYHIAIDDFGTGYSNLSSISQFPLTCLKIDKSFISQLPASGPIVRLILTLGQQIGATVVSEGVETQAQMDWLAAHQCTEAQGFLITEALPEEEFTPFVKDYGVKKT